MNNLASRVAAVNRIADQLLASDQRNQESIRATREQLNVRWVLRVPGKEGQCSR